MLADTARAHPAKSVVRIHLNVPHFYFCLHYVQACLLVVRDFPIAGICRNALEAIHRNEKSNLHRPASHRCRLYRSSPPRLERRFHAL